MILSRLLLVCWGEGRAAKRSEGVLEILIGELPEKEVTINLNMY